MLTGGDSGPAIVESQPEQSLLVDYLTTGLMPPEDIAVRPTEKEIATIVNWIAGGATIVGVEPVTIDRGFYITEQERQFWSFKPVIRPVLPTVINSQLARNPIDLFLLDKLEKAELTFSSEAGREVLIRRAYLDLTGLPPSPQAVKSFVANDDPAAYENLIDQLLALPQYGERWGRMACRWMRVQKVRPARMLNGGDYLYQTGDLPSRMTDSFRATAGDELINIRLQT